jgi:hypothetical protein
MAFEEEEEDVKPPLKKLKLATSTIAKGPNGKYVEASFEPDLRGFLQAARYNLRKYLVLEELFPGDKDKAILLAMETTVKESNSVLNYQDHHQAIQKDQNGIRRACVDYVETFSYTFYYIILKAFRLDIALLKRVVI